MARSGRVFSPFLEFPASLIYASLSSDISSATREGTQRMDFFTGRLWHHLSSTETLETFETDPDKGLDRFQVQRRAAEFGPNALTTRKGKTRLERLLLQFHILRILLVGGTLLLAGAEIMAMAVLAFLVVEFEKSMRMRKL